MINSDVQLIDGHRILLPVKANDLTSEAWIEENKKSIEQFLSTNGVLLIRGLKIDTSEEFAHILENLFEDNLSSYTYRSTPRTQLNNNIYTATEYHASEIIPQHNENAYSNSWPMRIGFVCMTPAKIKGNTPISDSRIAYQKIPADIKEEFERKGVMYVRNYSDIDLPWTEVFQTHDKRIVEKYCDENRIKYEWTQRGLRTKQVNQATALHPVTKDKLWFNQAHLFHFSSLSEEIQEALLSLLGEEELPRNAYFGDGSPIDIEALSIIRETYETTKFSFQWEKNDLLLLDNMLFTHGREPYEGTRQILVGMARECRVL
jgi:alpha-ketoglutarate-dependent taurine dioxygenase